MILFRNHIREPNLSQVVSSSSPAIERHMETSDGAEY
jgi:hypothetical protein